MLFLRYFLFSVFLIYLAAFGTAEKYMTWMTPYNTTTNINWDVVLANVPSNCSLKHVHLIARHGSRTLAKIQIDNVNFVIAKVAKFVHNNNETSDLLKNLSNWRDQFPHGYESLLPLGKAEHRFLADNYMNLFAKYNLTGTLMFSSSSSPRAIESCEAFANEWNASSFNILPNLIDDPRLSFFTTCERYVTEIRSNISSRPELIGLPKSLEAVHLVQQFNDRLLGQKNTSNAIFKYGDIAALYYVFGIEQILGVSSILGQIFQQSDLQFFDYADDLETWWKSAYGYPLNYLSSCSLNQQIFSLAADQTTYAGVFGFTHSEVLESMFAVYGLFNDTQPFRANATRDFMELRQYKCSEIIPFAANMAFLFFDCPGTGSNVALVVNGKVVRFPTACPDSDICSLSAVQAAYSWMSTCSQADICEL